MIERERDMEQEICRERKYNLVREKCSMIEDLRRWTKVIIHIDNIFGKYVNVFELYDWVAS